MAAPGKAFNRKLIPYLLVAFLVFAGVGFAFLVTTSNPTTARKEREKEEREKAVKAMPEGEVKSAQTILKESEDKAKEEVRKAAEEELKMTAANDARRKKELEDMIIAMGGGRMPSPTASSPSGVSGSQPPLPPANPGGRGADDQFVGLPQTSAAAVSKSEVYENYGGSGSSGNLLVDSVDGANQVGNAALGNGRRARGDSPRSQQSAQSEGAEMGGDVANRQASLDSYGPDEVSEAITPKYPVSDYMLMTGSSIPVVLLTGINSQNPGKVVARVTTNVYDSIRGTKLLIPRGAKINGTYSSKVTVGADRLPITFESIKMNDGRTVDLPQMSGADRSGQSGMTGDYHGNYLSAIIPPFLVGLAGQWASDQSDSDASTTTSNGTVNENPSVMEQVVPQIAQTIGQRYANAQPYFTIDPGEQLMLQVSADMAIPPYGNRVTKVNQ